MDDEDDALFTDIAKHAPFRLGHTMEVVGVVEEEGLRMGIHVKVREDRKTGYVPLCDLEVVPKTDRNYWLVREYVVWDANH